MSDEKDTDELARRVAEIRRWVEDPAVLWPDPVLHHTRQMIRPLLAALDRAEAAAFKWKRRQERMYEERNAEATRATNAERERDRYAEQFMMRMLEAAEGARRAALNEAIAVVNSYSHGDCDAAPDIMDELRALHDREAP